MKILIKTFHGLEQVLAKELADLGAKEVQLLNRAVMCEGDQKLLYRANFELRTALRVLVPIHSFTATNEQQLYQKAYAFDWSKHLKLEQTFAINSVVNSDHFTHSQFVALKIKDAIADQFRSKFKKRPSVDVEYADIRFNVYVNQADFSLYLDSSGESLHRRGYRVQGHFAPLNEVLGAGMILLSEWESDVAFIDLMCGSGTLLMESCLIATQTPPGIKRKSYSFQNWTDYRPELLNQIRKESMSNIVEPRADIVGSDIASQAFQLSKEAISSFGFEPYIQLSQKPFDKYIPSYEKGILMMNPPYGERMGNKDMNAFYAEIGSHLKNHFSGFDAWLISSNFTALKHIGLRPSRKITLYNAALECKFQKFSMYKGSKKASKQMDN